VCTKMLSKATCSASFVVVMGGGASILNSCQENCNSKLRFSALILMQTKKCNLSHFFNAFKNQH
jgi:hypothetical protein